MKFSKCNLLKLSKTSRLKSLEQKDEKLIRELVKASANRSASLLKTREPDYA